MPKREDVPLSGNVKVDQCPHGHWPGVCKICRLEELKQDNVFKNVKWLD